MKMISRLAAVHSLPQFGLQGDDLVFVGRITFGDEGEQDADVWYIPAEDAVRIQHHTAEHEMACFPVSVARMMKGRFTTAWGEAMELYDEMKSISTRVKVDPYLGNVRISAHHDVHTDENGEGGYGLIFVTHDGVPQDLLNEYVRELHPSTHCQHEYDCCGRAYSDRANCIQYSDVMAIYQQSWHLNI